MSRIGKKPILLPAGVKYTVSGNTVLVEGPKGKVSAMLPGGITLVQKDGNLVAERQTDKPHADVRKEASARGSRAATHCEMFVHGVRLIHRIVTKSLWFNNT